MNDRLDLAQLAPHAPKRNVADFLRRTIDPDFLERCVDKQASVAAQRAAARKRGDDVTITAPLAGVLIGTKQQYPALYEGFFALVKAGVMARHQRTAITEGMPFAGVKSGDRVAVTERDFIDPLTVHTREGVDIDLRAESALVRLSRSWMEVDRVFNAETVLSRGEAGALEATQFAHSEYQVLSESLLTEVLDVEGLLIPWDASPRDARALAETISDTYLRTRVLAALDQMDGVDDSRRVYLHSEGQPAFRVRKIAPVEKWKPYTPTPPQRTVPEPTPQKRRPSRTTTAKQRVVSVAAHADILTRLSALRQERETISELMGSAIEDGDLRESAAYDEARTRMFETDAAISQLERDLLDVEPGDVDSNIGRTFEITIAGVPKTVRLTDGHPRIGEVSTASPLGQALLHATAGQTVTVTSTHHRLVPTTSRQIMTAGTVTSKRHVPAGVTAPAITDVHTQYTSTLVTYKREQPVQVVNVIHILSIT
ncbi:transcription elongation factor [Deinococcus sp. 14RED07]|uniref:transcription elongation factor n=1 Tax=Deinococcus sp. 14RED07 TaxID=2745874 RepID=UPI001E3751D5|nr:transcription elongation factor [Deinococcus sp. 14RED07]